MLNCSSDAILMFDFLVSAIERDNVVYVTKYAPNLDCINRLTRFDLSLLDMALLLDHRQVIEILQENGAFRSVKYKNCPKSRYEQLKIVTIYTTEKIQTIKDCTVYESKSSNSLFEEYYDTVQKLNHDLKILNKMMTNLECAIDQVPKINITDGLFYRNGIILFLEIFSNFYLFDFEIIVIDQKGNQRKSLEKLKLINNTHCVFLKEYKLTDTIYIQCNTIGKTVVSSPEFIPNFGGNYTEFDEIDQNKIRNKLEYYLNTLNHIQFEETDNDKSVTKMMHHFQPTRNLSKRGLQIGYISIRKNKLSRYKTLFLNLSQDIDRENLKHYFRYFFRLCLNYDCVQKLIKRELTLKNYAFHKKILFSIQNLQKTIGKINIGIPYWNYLDFNDAVIFLIIDKDPMIVDKLSNQYFRNSHLFLQASILQSIKCISYQHFNMQLLSDGLYAMYLNSSFTIDGTYNIMINPLEPHHLPNVLIREIPLISNKEWSSLFDRNQQNIFKTFVYNLIMPFLKQYSINNCDEIYIYDKLIHLKKNVKVILLYKMSHSPTQSCEELNFINLTTFENYYAYMYYNSTFKMFCNTSYDYYFYEKVAKKSYSQELIKLKNDITTTWNQFQWIKRTLESINTKYSKRYKFELQDNI